MGGMLAGRGVVELKDRGMAGTVQSCEQMPLACVK